MTEPHEKPDLSRLDADFIRVLEDLVEVLIDKGVINLTDLPPEAQQKLSERRVARRRLRDALDLIQGDDDIL